MRWAKRVVFALACAAILLAVIQLEQPYGALDTQSRDVAGTPVTLQQLLGAERSPAVVIAHGFAGSRQLMQPFAVTLARNGYQVLSFDFLGHGRNQRPLTGDVTREEGATQALLAETQKVIDYARALPGATGQVALLGHSMASDILVRTAREDPDIAAVIAVSMFSEQVTPQSPANLLMIVGAYEGFLLRASLAHLARMGVIEPQAGVTVGPDPAAGRRRVAVAPGTEHVSVLYSQTSLREALAWLDQVFDRQSAGWIEHRAPWLGLLFAGIVALGWPLAGLLQRNPSTATPLSTKGFLGLSLLAMLATPLILWPLPTAFLPVMVADYLAVHFLLYGVILWAGLSRLSPTAWRLPDRALVLQILAATLFVTGAMAWPLDRYVASFVPGSLDRLQLIAILALGTLGYCTAEARLLTREGRRWWWPVTSKLAFLASLAIAVALDLRELFFLILILPVILVFFMLYGLFNRWIYCATEHPSVGGVAMGIAFAWALGVTFPLLAN